MNKKFRTSILLFCFFFVLTSAASAINENIGKTKNTDTGIVIPPPAFKVKYRRSDPGRPVRAHGRMYEGAIIDTHSHLYPPRGKEKDFLVVDRIELNDIIRIIKNLGVELIIFMPTPNDEIRPNHELGVAKRKMIRELDRDRIAIFCGSNYITCWLNSAYHNGYNKRQTDDILKRLSKDIDSGEYCGVGEIATNHFDKGYRRQSIIQYPPNFEPFLLITDVIADMGMWLDLHAEPVDPKRKSYEDQVFGGLELLFRRNPSLKLIYSHTAMTNPINARSILKKYPNIMMNIKIETRHHKWRNLEPVINTEGDLYEDWAELFEEMPERFMIGVDFHFGRKGVELQKYEKKIKQFRQMLGTLDPEAARLIAFENAEKILTDIGSPFPNIKSH
jgi:hypothetical protein